MRNTILYLFNLGLRQYNSIQVMRLETDCNILTTDFNFSKLKLIFPNY